MMIIIGILWEYDGKMIMGHFMDIVNIIGI